MGDPILRAVDATLPAPPYAETVRAGNYGLQMDYGRIQQSDTWAFAPDDVKPWLVYLWLLSWQRIPCATLPNDDDKIALILRMPQGMFAAHKRTLLSGWRLHNDDRLYHDYLTSQVLTMERDRRRFRERMQRHRAQHPDSSNVTRDATVTHSASQDDVDVYGKSKALPLANGTGIVDNSASIPTKIVGKDNSKPEPRKPRPGESHDAFVQRMADELAARKSAKP